MSENRQRGHRPRWWPRWWFAAGGVVAVAAVAVVLTAIGGNSPGADPTAGAINVQAGGGSAVGDRAAPFTAATINGGQVKVPAGKPVVLLFMATWCAPQLEATALDRVERDLGDKITVLGVDIDPKEPAADLQAFADSIHSRYSYVHDLAGALTAAYKVQAMDSTIVIDAAGRIVYRDTIPTDEATLRAALTKATAAGSAS